MVETSCNLEGHERDTPSSSTIPRVPSCISAIPQRYFLLIFYNGYFITTFRYDHVQIYYEMNRKFNFHFQFLGGFIHLFQIFQIFRKKEIQLS